MTDGTLPPALVDLLHCLGFIYLRHGQPRRAVVLLLLAADAASDRPEVLRTLCAAMVAAGLGEQALELLDSLVALDPGSEGHKMMRLMRARALLLVGRAEEARRIFRVAEVSPDAPRRSSVAA